MKSNNKEAYDALLSCKGATTEEIEQAEKKIGFPFPSDLRRSLQCHDIVINNSDLDEDEDEYDESGPLILFKNYGYSLSLKVLQYF